MPEKNKEQTTSQCIEKLIREVLPWQFAKSEIMGEHDLQGDLGIDSLGKVALAFRVEEELGVDLSSLTEEVLQICTVADVIEVVDSLMTAS